MEWLSTREGPAYNLQSLMDNVESCQSRVRASADLHDDPNQSSLSV